MTHQLLPVLSRRLGLFTALASLALTAPSLAQSVWTGSSNNEFSEDANWSPNAPGAADAATVNSGSPQVSNNATISKLDVDGGNLTVTNTGALTVTNGSIITAGSVGINAGGALNSDVDLNGGGLLLDGSLNGRLTLNTGNVAVNGALGSATVGVGTALSNNGTVGDVSVSTGGTFTNNSFGTAATLDNAGTASNAGSLGTLTNTAGNFTNNSGGTVTGKTTVSGGTVTNNFVVTDADVAAAAAFVNNNGATAGNIRNSGTVTNTGTVASLQIDAGTFTNNAGGVVNGATNISGGAVTNNADLSDVNVGTGGTFTNTTAGSAGAVVNAGTSSNAGSVAALTNTAGSFTNNAGGEISGKTTISGGTVTNNFVVTDADVAAAAAFVNNSGATAGDVRNSGTVTNAGTIASLQNDAGTFTNNVGGVVTGVTTVSDGTVTNNFVVTDADVAAAAAFVNNSGATAGNIRNAGTVTNAGTIASLQNDGGSFINNAGGDVTGTTKINAGTVVNNATLSDVEIDAQATFANNSGAIAGAVTNAGVAANDGTIASLVNIDGSFSNTGTISGTAAVTGGELINQGTVTGTIDIFDGGLLSGSGAAGGLVVNAGGTLAPGPGIQTLAVNGNLTFRSGSTYELDINASGLSDQVNASGAIAIDGGTLDIKAANGAYGLATDYTILIAGSVTGAFDTIESDFAFLSPTLTYGNATVDLNLDRNDVRFQDVALTSNDRATAAAIETLGASSTVFSAILPLDSETAESAFAQLNGEIHASLKSALLWESQFAREAVIDRMSPFDRRQLNDDFVSLWASGIFAQGNFSSDGNARGLGSTVTGSLFGADLAVSDQWRLGGLLGYSHLSTEPQASADSYHVGLYAAGDIGPLSVIGGAIYTRNETSTRRDIVFGTFTDQLSVDYASNTTQFFADIAWTLAGENFNVQPFANLAYIDLNTDAFGENGGAAALSVPGASNDMAISTLGIRWSSNVLTGNLPVFASGMLGWRHATGDLSPGSLASFEGSSPFLLEGIAIPQDALVLKAGITARLSKSARLSLTYSGEFGSGFQSNAARANLSVEF
jgi:outer membrane autotransporter protein